MLPTHAEFKYEFTCQTTDASHLFIQVAEHFDAGQILKHLMDVVSQLGTLCFKMSRDWFLQLVLGVCILLTLHHLTALGAKSCRSPHVDELVLFESVKSVFVLCENMRSKPRVKEDRKTITHLVLLFTNYYSRPRLVQMRQGFDPFSRSQDSKAQRS